MLRRTMHRLTNPFRSERGITGLETTIVLIAFIVVASVFSYTVLTAGVFSSQKSSEAVNAAIDEVRSTITINGSTIAYKGAVDTDAIATTTSDRKDSAVKIAVTIAVALQGVPVDVTSAWKFHATNKSLITSGNTNSLVINYIEQNQVVNNVAWTEDFSGSNGLDDSLEATERAVLTIWLVEYNYDNTAGLYYSLGGSADTFASTTASLLGNFESFSLEMSPVQGAPLIIEKVVPQSLNDIMNLR